MPKIVDHEAQRMRIAWAVWQLVVRDGMGEVSVRNVAREAGLSQGAMRYYFSSQAELLLFSMQQVTEGVNRRIEALRQQDVPPRERVRNMLLEILPVDKVRRTEMQVWWAFVNQALVDESLHEHASQVYDALRQGMVDAINWLRRKGELKPGLSPAREAERLYALVDGLAIHAILKPDAMPARTIRQVLDHHLDTLCITSGEFS